MTTVIMHFYNEDYLLPWWLSHHTPLFDHGILIDYDSTDASIGLCRELAPDWEIRTSRNRHFAAAEVDAEVMDIERGLSGWKIALTTTEFLLCRGRLHDALAFPHCGGIRTRSAVLVDPPELIDVEPDYMVPLLSQRYWGYAEGNLAGTHRRLIHKHSCGGYRYGRHSYEAPHVESDLLCTVWLQFCPMTPRGRCRKTQIGARIPAGDRALQLGCHHYTHLATEKGLMGTYSEMVPRVSDLRLIPWYAAMLTEHGTGSLL